MAKNRLAGLIIVIVGLLFLGIGSRHASANINAQNHVDYSWQDQLATNSDQPTPLAVSEVAPTPEERVLPPVWSNAGLVLAASVLVLIIVGGVLGTRLREKH